MDNPNWMILTLGKPLRTQLIKTKPTFQEVSKKEFQDIQQTCKHVRSMVYRTLDQECQDGTSKVTFHSLSYVKRRTGIEFSIFNLRRTGIEFSILNLNFSTD